MPTLKGFFAYASDPRTVGEAIIAAAKEINKATEIKLEPWIDLRIGGKILIDTICEKIEDADLFCADLTTLNPNVLFELGFATARNKRVWITRDRSFPDHESAFRKFKILTTIGYRTYQNSLDIVNNFYTDLPHQDLSATLLSQCVNDELYPDGGLADGILYLKANHQTDAAIQINRRVDKSPLRQILDDPAETAMQPVAWYVQNVKSVGSVICKMVEPDREDAALYNARSAFVAGIAFGFKKRLLILQQSELFAPLDYRDLSVAFKSATSAGGAIDKFLQAAEAEFTSKAQRIAKYESTLARIDQLKSLRIGDYLAENEQDEAIAEQFVETAPYVNALNGSQRLFIGRKGAGKTAIFKKLVNQLGRDKRNLVVPIRPAGYDIRAVIRLMQQVQQKHDREYAIESLWKFLMLSEVASVLFEEINKRPKVTLDESDLSFLVFMQRPEFPLREPFAERLETIVSSLEASEHVRGSASELLHRGLLKDLRQHVLNCIGRRRRIAIVIDNIDLGWERQDNIQSLGEVTLSLINAAKSLEDDFRGRGKNDEFTLTAAVLLRSDLFLKILRFAEEADKISYDRIVWNDPEVLFRVIDERLSAADGGVDPADVWARYFTTTVSGRPVKEFLLKATFPRPRDLIFLMRSAVSKAISRKHESVSSDDFNSAQEEYAEFASGVLSVEAGVSVNDFETYMLSFYGGHPSLTEAEALNRLSDAGIEFNARAGIIEMLVSLGFLGPLIQEGNFVYADDILEYRRMIVKAKRYCCNAIELSAFSTQ